MKIEEMADVFWNLANFAKHRILTLAPPRSYALNLRALIKVSKVSWTSQLLYEILRSSLKIQFDMTNFISPKSTPPKSPVLLGLRYILRSGNPVVYQQQLDFGGVKVPLKKFSRSRNCIERQSTEHTTKAMVKGQTAKHIHLKFCANPNQNCSP